MKLKRIIVLLLALCALSSLAVGCKRQEEPDDETGEVGTVNTDPILDAEGNVLFSKIADDLPSQMDFGGKNLRMVIRSGEKFASEFDTDNAMGGVLSSEIYRRHLSVESRLNVKIEICKDSASSQGPFSDIAQKLSSGEYIYDIAAGSSYIAAEYAMQGQYRNLRKIPNLNLEKEYWSRGMIDSLTVGGATYFTTGSISTYYYDSAYVIYFNKALAAANGISAEQLYADVLDGKWTLDKMIETTKNIYVDNGNGTEDSGDTYGFGLMVSSATDGFWSSFDMPMSQADDSGKLTFLCDVDMIDALVTKLNTFVWQTPATVALSESTATMRDEVPNAYLYDKQFADGKIVFVTDLLYATSGETMRNMTDDYGVLPYPKYDEMQDEYKTYVHDQMTIFGIPYTVPNDRLEAVGAFLEVMCSEGHNSVLPVYYEKVLTARNVRDLESVQMVDIILKGMWNDRIWFYNRAAGRITALMLREQVWFNKNTVSSTYASSYKSVNTVLASVHDNYIKYSGN